MSAQPQAVIPAQTEAQPRSSTFYVWYVVAVLMVAYVFSFIDRQIFSMVVGPLRRDLHITDTQVSYLQGLSFVVFYTFFGILIGRLVDIYSRRTIICIGMVLWSLFTTGCGMAGTYWQMLALRMGVGVGEAALSPAAYSLVTDYVPPKRLSTAIGLYGAGIYIGSGLSFLLGGLIRGYAATKGALILPLVGQIHPWQILFFVVGVPGILLAPLLYTIREPQARGGSTHPTVPIGQVFGYIFRNCKTFLLHNIGFGLLSLTAYASSAWVPEFYVRTYHWNIRNVGVIYGVLVMVLGSLGIVGAGRVADYLRVRGHANANIKVGMWIGIIWFPLNFLMLLSPSPVWATIWLAPACVLAAAPFGVAPAAIQQMMPANMRGQASAVYLFILNLVGLGLGPTAVAWGTQYLFHRDDALRYSMLVVFSTACLLGAGLLWACLRPFLGSLDCLEQHKAKLAA
ncbi:MAG TPA: MFS transporter [Candidatus Angelobacter sp.]|nr:MFS transporter [Candidatus Angelobacter sp.]